MKGPAESGQICSVGRRKIAKEIAKNKRCYAYLLGDDPRLLLRGPTAAAPGPGKHLQPANWLGLPPRLREKLSVRHMSNLLNRGRTIADYGPTLQRAPEDRLPLTCKTAVCIIRTGASKGRIHEPS